jgi:hypothetical protein
MNWIRTAEVLFLFTSYASAAEQSVKHSFYDRGESAFSEVVSLRLAQFIARNEPGLRGVTRRSIFRMRQFV